MTLREVAEASSLIHDTAHPDANIIFGTVIDKKLQGELKITVIATGFAEGQATRRSPLRAVDLHPRPQPMARPAEPEAEMPQAAAPPEPAAPSPPPAPEMEEKPKEHFTFPGSAAARNLNFGNESEAYGNRMSGRDDDLDVPTFLRKQMD